MKNDHIKELLEHTPVIDLSEGERLAVERHTSRCDECLRAYKAAQIASVLLKTRASEIVEPTPFFKTRVMAALRERQAVAEVPAILRMWKAAGAMVSSMVALVVILLTMTFFYNNNQVQNETSALASSQNLYSAEYVVFDADDLRDEEISYGQVLTTLYDSQDAYGEYK